MAVEDSGELVIVDLLLPLILKVPVTGVAVRGTLPDTAKLHRRLLPGFNRLGVVSNTRGLFSRGYPRPVAAVNSTPMYADYGASAEQYEYSNPWAPSYLPDFGNAEAAAEEAYQEEQYYQQEEVAAVSRPTFGRGTPHRTPHAAVDNTQTVRDSHDEWWTDLQPTSVFLVGFNKAVVCPLGRLSVSLRVNNRAFDTEFHVVERCNSPLLCLRDADRAGLVRVAPPPAVAEFAC